MAPKHSHIRNEISYGYNNTNQQRYVGNLGLPREISCHRCRRVKTIDGFSAKQLDEARTQHRLHKRIHIVCRECNSATVVEVTCVECYETKGLNDFYKAQRRNPENARCIECSDERKELDPAVTKDEDDSSDSEDSISDTDTQTATESLATATETTESLADASSTTGGVGIEAFNRLAIDGPAADGATGYKPKTYTSGGSKASSSNWHTMGASNSASSSNWHTAGNASAFALAGRAQPTNSWASPLDGQANFAGSSVDSSRVPSVTSQSAYTNHGGFDPSRYRKQTAPSISAESDIGSMTTDRASTRKFVKVPAYRKPAPEHGQKSSRAKSSKNRGGYDSDDESDGSCSGMNAL